MRTFACALVVLASGVSAHAASVNWGSPTNIVNDGDVSTNGTLVGAVNLDGPSTTVNGVMFQSLDVINGPMSIGNFSLTGFFFNGPGLGTGVGSGVAPFASLSASYQSLLNSAAAVAGDITLTMSGLTIGQTYEFQVWANDSRDQDPPGFTFIVDVSDGVNIASLDPNLTLADGGLGQYVKGTFTADAVTQVITMGNSEVGIVNGFQLRQIASNPPSNPVPVPASVWGGLVLGGFLAVRVIRRRLQAA